MDASRAIAAAGLAAAFMLCACQTAPASSSNANAAALHVTARYPGPDGGWDFSTIDPAHHRLYLSRSNGVTALDLSSGLVTPMLVAGSRTHIALPVNSGSDILVTNGATAGAFIADAQTGAIRVQSIPTGAKPDAAFVEPTTGLAWVLDNDGGGIAMIDTHFGRVTGRIEVPGALESPASDGHGTVYITVEDHSEVVVIDAHSRRVTKHYPLADCEGPTGLAYDAHDQRLIAECANGALKIISAHDGHLLASLPLGSRPDGLIYDERRNLVFAPTGGDAMMSVIDPAHLSVIGHVSTRGGARSGALDPNTGDIYLPSGEFGPPVAPSTRPTLVPGSFQILRVGA